VERIPLRVCALGSAVSVAALVVGCSSVTVSQPFALGDDTYKISATSSRGGPQVARASAVSAARQHCARLLKNLLLLSSSSDIYRQTPAQEAAELEPKAVIDVTFRCLAASDPAVAPKDQ